MFRKKIPIVIFLTLSLVLWGGEPTTKKTEPVILEQVNGYTFQKAGPSFQVSRSKDKEKTYQDVIVILKGDSLSKQMRKASRNKNLSRVQFKALVEAESSRQKAARYQLTQELKRVDGRVVLNREFGYLLNGLALKVKTDQIQTLRSHPMVESVHFDRIAQAYLEDSVAQVGAPAVWATLDDQGRTVQGQDMVVAVIDSGIDYNHPDLGGGFGPGFKVMGGYDFHNNDDDPMDDNSHGTHVAGIVAGKGEVMGVAPEASLLAYKVLGQSGRGRNSSIIAGIERAADPDQDPLTDDRPDVINLSLGGRGDADDPMSQAVDEAVENGIVVIAAAGNSGDAIGALGSPASSRKALTVGAVDKEGLMASFSSRGPGQPFAVKPEITAPGVAIRSTELDGTHDTKNGTSMAAPHVAGAAALLRQIHPDWEPERIVKHLIHTAAPLEENHVMAHGAGILDLEAALEQSASFSLRSLSFGQVDLSQAQWSTQETVEVVNHTNTPQTLQFSIQGTIPEGVSFTLDKENATLEPGQSESLILTASVNNEIADFPENSSLTFGARLEVLEGERKRSLPMVARKSVKVDVQFEGGGFFYVLWGDVIDSTGGYIEEDFAVHVRPGTYSLMGSHISFDASGTLSFLQQEDLVVGAQDMMVDFSSMARYNITQTFTDLDGQEHELVGEIPAATYHGFTHKPTNITFTFITEGYTGPFKATGHSDAFLVECLTVTYLDGNRFAEAGFWFEGLDSDAHFNTSLAQNHEIVYKIPGADPNFGSAVFYNCYNPNIFYNLELPLTGLNPAGSPQAPFDLTIYTLPQGETDDTLRLTHRTLSGFNWPVIWNSPVTIVTTDTERKDVRTDRLHQSGVVNMGEGPFFPIAGFSNEKDTIIGTSLPYNGMGVFALSFSSPYELLLPDGSILDGSNFSILHSLDSELEGEIVFSQTFNSRLDGQIAEGTYQAWFDLSRENPNPPYIHELQLTRDDEVTSLAPQRLSLSLGDGTVYPQQGAAQPHAWALLESASVSWRVDGDWMELSGQLEEGVFTADLPSLDPGLLADLKITATNFDGSRLECEINRAWRSGYTQVVPWVVNNDQWRSRLAVYNPQDQAVTALLTGVDRDGERRFTEVSIPKGGVYAVDSDQLFGDLTGYSLEIESLSHLETSFLTYNIGSQSGGNSPSLTTGASVQHLSNRLLFPYLASDQIPAVVLSAPDQGAGQGEGRETRVKLYLFGNGALQPLEKDLVLQNDRPQAWLLSDLFPDAPPNPGWSLYAHSWSGVKLAGSMFSFNQLREPSMAAPLSAGHDITTRQIVPWVVNNPQWASRISVFNQSGADATVQFTAVTTTGEEHQREEPLPLATTTVFEASELFPDLSGYTLFMDASTEQLPWNAAHISASFMTFNKEAASGGNSPSQTTAIQSYEPAAHLTFSYLPGDQISALVLTAPEGDGETPITLTLYNETGQELDQAPAVLTDRSPMAVLLTDLFPNVSIPRDAAVKVSSDHGGDITGTAFIFNEQREPSMTKPVGGR